MTAPTRDQQNERYRAGVCVDCGNHPHSAGRPRCTSCHHAHIRTPTSPDAQS